MKEREKQRVEGTEKFDYGIAVENQTKRLIQTDNDAAMAPSANAERVPMADTELQPSLSWQQQTSLQVPLSSKLYMQPQAIPDSDHGLVNVHDVVSIVMPMIGHAMGDVWIMFRQNAYAINCIRGWPLLTNELPIKQTC